MNIGSEANPESANERSVSIDMRYSVWSDDLVFIGEWFSRDAAATKKIVKDTGNRFILASSISSQRAYNKLLKELGFERVAYGNRLSGHSKGYVQLWLLKQDENLSTRRMRDEWHGRDTFCCGMSTQIARIDHSIGGTPLGKYPLLTIIEQPAETKTLTRNGYPAWRLCRGEHKSYWVVARKGAAPKKIEY